MTLHPLSSKEGCICIKIWVSLQKRTVIVIRLPFFSVIFAFGELYWLRQLYLLRKLYCPMGSFGGEYNITAAKRQYRFCVAKISLRRRRNITKKGSVTADIQPPQSLFFMKFQYHLAKVLSPGLWYRLILCYG